MTCKDCIHCRACHEMWLIAVSQEDDFFERNDADTCEDFKNKADFVEVVRCKDCKQFMEYAEGVQSIECANGDCFIRMMNSIDRQFCGVKYDDFCSYGERK